MFPCPSLLKWSSLKESWTFGLPNVFYPALLRDLFMRTSDLTKMKHPCVASRSGPWQHALEFWFGQAACRGSIPEPMVPVHFSQNNLFPIMVLGQMHVEIFVHIQDQEKSGAREFPGVWIRNQSRRKRLLPMKLAQRMAKQQAYGP